MEELIYLHGLYPVVHVKTHVEYAIVNISVDVAIKTEHIVCVFALPLYEIEQYSETQGELKARNEAYKLIHDLKQQIELQNMRSINKLISKYSGVVLTRYPEFFTVKTDVSERVESIDIDDVNPYDQDFIKPGAKFIIETRQEDKGSSRAIVTEIIFKKDK